MHTKIKKRKQFVYILKILYNSVGSQTITNTIIILFTDPMIVSFAKIPNGTWTKYSIKLK